MATRLRKPEDFLTNTPHQYVHDRASDTLTFPDPGDYITLIHGTCTRPREGRDPAVYTTEKIYIGLGKCWYGPGQEIFQEDLPEWCWNELRKLTPDARKAIQFQLPEERIERATQLDTDFINFYTNLPPDMRKQLEQLAYQKSLTLEEQQHHWTCPDCGEYLKTTSKGAHMLMHKRAEKSVVKEQE